MSDATQTSTQPAAEDGSADLSQHIREAIMRGEFAPHQRLIEADLSDRFGASRATVRTALLHLAGEGIVERLPNRGARVRSITIDEAVEIVEVRIGLESLCASKAAEHLTDTAADQLRAIRRDLEDAVGRGDLMAYASLNQEMDRQIRELSGHATATQLLERLRAQSARHQFRLSFVAGRAAVSLGEHVAIIDGVLGRDPEAAAAATRAHLLGIIDVLRTLD
ncbi:GntR family transcriptional regulator [Microbacterium invictum]|uniref:DNA-binding GntR family transcriptional regulator n=1 Tax=Microbacterium invictum TaxID=515415 RepID=A0AA40SR89_9MICO|nr:MULTISPECIES: GntR family transcriptional regulator [Microbacterium]MBB4140962.1 DNA-binding GntR family transcriptional regulator [Microbacterium invictum]